MELVIFRHGDALAVSDDGNDFSRRLSQEGIYEVKISSENLKISGVKPNLIITSPFIRARETTEIIKSFFENTEIVISNDLSPNSSPINVINLINSLKEKNIILVSHMPLVSEIAYCLLGKNIRFSTSSYLYLIKRGESFEILSKYRI